MSNRLDSKPQISKLASDLGLQRSDSPTRTILQFVVRRVRKIAKKFGCRTLNDLLIATANEVSTLFEEIHSDDDLQKIQMEYVSKGETGFANLEADLSGVEDYAITIRRTHRDEWDPEFVSIIDCRGSKMYRKYFSKWHELAHLLTLTPQLRLVFRRSHSGCAARDPEELLMDVIAGETGFFQDFLPGTTSSELSFQSLLRVKEACCPDASVQAAIIGIVKGLPVPCILVEAKMALRKHERANPLDASRRTLRAVNVTVNNAARDAGIRFHKNWRVPSDSVISRVFEEGGSAEAAEDLSWWVTSSGAGLDECPVIVKAKKAWESVQALLIPQVQEVSEPRPTSFRDARGEARA